MFFSLCGSLPTFQVFMNYNFTDYIREGWLVIYIDNLAIGANSMEDEERKVHLILQCFWDLGLSLKLSKCEFGKLEVRFLGMIVGSGCIHMDPAKLLAIAAWPLLKTVKAIRSFLGFCNFYHKFIPGFSNTVTPLTALTHKNQPWTWGSEQQTAFTTLLSHFQTTPVLRLPDVCHPFIVMTDTSLLANTLNNLATGSPLFPCSSLMDWHFSDSCLYFKNCLYIPPDACHNLVASIHSSLALGHGEFFHTYSLLSHDYWWPGMSSFVRCFISGCTLCQQMKVNTHPTVPTLSPLPSICTCPFQQLSVDLITDHPSSHGHDSLLVVVYHSLLKGVILTPCNKTLDTNGVAELFFKHVFLRFGLHDHLISDWGPQFASTFTAKLACILRYDLKLFTAYHPQTDGKTEQVNQEVEMYLQMFCQGQPDKWSELIPMAEFAHNSATHLSTQKSPFSLILGYEPRDYPKIGQMFLPSLKDRLTLLEQARDEVLAAHEKAQQSMKEQITTKFIPWKVRDKVWLKGKNLRL